jgi:hypothetical protein
MSFWDVTSHVMRKKKVAGTDVTFKQTKSHKVKITLIERKN